MRANEDGTMGSSNRLAFVLSGAGTLAAAHVGAVNALEKNGYLPDYLIGTSAGAIVSALLALGYTPSELRKIVLSLDYKRLLPFNFWLAPFRKYLASNKPVARWLQEMTRGKTMKECEIPLTTITTDLVKGRAVTFSTESTPEVPVWKAVLASMSIPDVFPLFEEKYVDGGVTCNLGVNFVPYGFRAIALRIRDGSVAGPVKGFFNEQERLLSLMLSASERDMVLLAEERGIPVIDLDCSPYGFLDRDLPLSGKEKLYQIGYTAAKTWVSQQHNTNLSRYPS